MQQLRTRLIERHLMATEVIPVDLPTHPLSHLVLTVAGYNATDEATLAEMLSFLNTIQVSRNGQAICDLQSEDLYAVNARLFRSLPTLTGRLATDNYTRSLTLIVPFGRRLFRPDECLPAAPKGELKLRVDTTVPATSWDNAVISIDAVELPDASPARWLKLTQATISAPGATGVNKIQIACGNRLLCHQLRLTTVPTTSSTTWGVQDVALLIGNQEHQITAADAMCLMGERFLRVGNPDTTIAAQGLSPLSQILWVDYDPTDADDGGIDLAGVTDCKLALNMGVNEATVMATAELASK